MMKKILVTTGIVLALFLLVLFLLPFFININDIVAKQIPVIEKKIHRKVAIGDVKLTILSGLGAKINNVSISNNPDFKQQNFVRIEKLKANVKLLPLLKKEIMISSVSIERPSVVIERNAQGKMNFSDMIVSAETEKEAKNAPAATETKDPLSTLENIQISKISIREGNFKFFDSSDAKASKEIALDKFNLLIKGVSLSQKIYIDLDTDIYASPKAVHVALSGDLGPIGKNPEPDNIPVDLTLSLSDINFSHLASYMKGMSVKSGSMNAITTLKGKLRDKLQCRINLDWDNLNMVLDDTASKDSSARQLIINGPWKIETDISGPPKKLGDTAIGPMEDLGFKSNVDATGGKIVFGNLFQKDSGTPFSIGLSGRLKKDTLRIDDLKIILSKIVLKGSADIGHLADPFIDGKVSIAPTPLSALAPVLPMLKTYELDGILELSDTRFKGKIDELKNLKGISGNLTIKNGSAASAELGKKFEKIQASAIIANNAIRIKNTSLRIGKSDLSINATVRNPMKPDISFNLGSSYLDLDALLGSPSGKKKAESAKKEAAAGSTPKAKTTLKAKTSEKENAPDLKVAGKVSIKKCIYDKLVLENVLAELVYADAVATLKNLTFNTLGGDISTSAKINLDNMQSPRWSADLTTRNIDANSALSQFTSIKDTFYGKFNIKSSFQGKGSDWPMISKTLAGSGSADIINGKLANVNLLDAVGQSLLKFQGLGQLAQIVSPGTQTKVKETSFQNLSGKFNIRDGKILLDTMAMSTRDFTLSGAGNIGLDKKLDLRTSLVLPQSTSARLEKDRIMRYLLNKDKRLEIPCAVKGDVTSPRIAADGDSLNRLLKNAATNAIQDQIQKSVEGKLGNEAGKLLKDIFK